MSEHEKQLDQLTDEQIEEVCARVLDGHSPGSRANVYAASSRDWPGLAVDLARLLRRKASESAMWKRRAEQHGCNVAEGDAQCG